MTPFDVEVQSNLEQKSVTVLTESTAEHIDVLLKTEC